MSALMATFVSIKTMADGSPRITLDIQGTLSQIADMGLIPGVPFALARLSKESANPVTQSAQEPKERAGQLCVMACNFCADPEFQEWLEVSDEFTAKAMILEGCKISSRKELDTNRDAADLFHKHIRLPFMAWKAQQ